jgi:hypothetical protein
VRPDPRRGGGGGRRVCDHGGHGVVAASQVAAVDVQRCSGVDRAGGIGGRGGWMDGWDLRCGFDGWSRGGERMRRRSSAFLLSLSLCVSACGAW